MTISKDFPQNTNRRIASNGIELNIAEQGKDDAPLIVMLHGFPESWFSWRHQFAPLAAAGYHVVAPDMRGYGESDKPSAITAYNQVEIVNDIKGLVDTLGYETAIVIGHDWGGPTAHGVVRCGIRKFSPQWVCCLYPLVPALQYRPSML